MALKLVVNNHDRKITQSVSDDSPFKSCDWCGESMYDGDALVELCRNVEYGQDGGSVMNVLESEEVLCLCEECGTQLTTRGLRDIFMETERQ